MLPAKSRERKCSTCRHYQASPLWRKGWCRNPLLYDRNTNHLVEADSLACNRTFIDYWEPITEGVGPAGSSARAGKPRIAPSIPMEPVDAKGQPSGSGDKIGSPYDTGDLRDVDIRDTPVSGASAARPLYRPATGRERPPLALVDDDYDELLGEPGDFSDTKQLPAAARGGKEREVELTKPGRGLQESARDRIQRARQIKRPSINIPQLSGIPLYVAVGTLAALLVVVAALFIFNRQSPATNTNVNSPPATQISSLPTPTGFGDSTPTNVAGTQPTAPPVRTDIIAVGGFVAVTGTGDGLVIRPAPTRAGDRRVAKLADGTKARVVDGPEEADGFTWWKLDSFDKNNAELSGWAVSEYLKATAP